MSLSWSSFGCVQHYYIMQGWHALRLNPKFAWELQDGRYHIFSMNTTLWKLTCSRMGPHFIDWNWAYHRFGEAWYPSINPDIKDLLMLIFVLPTKHSNNSISTLLIELFVSFIYTASFSLYIFCCDFYYYYYHYFSFTSEEKCFSFSSHLWSAIFYFMTSSHIDFISKFVLFFFRR